MVYCGLQKHPSHGDLSEGPVGSPDISSLLSREPHGREDIFKRGSFKTPYTTTVVEKDHHLMGNGALGFQGDSNYLPQGEQSIRFSAVVKKLLTLHQSA